MRGQNESSRLLANVWPPPPDEPRIQLDEILAGRADVEASSDFQRMLVGATPDPFRNLRKPHGITFDSQGRIWVSDTGLPALFRFDRAGRKMDVMGTTGAVQVQTPLGLTLGENDTVYVSDAGLKQVLVYDGEGRLVKVFGSRGELDNPTDSALSPDGTKLYVTDSKAHQIVVFDLDTGELLRRFGRLGVGEGEFHFPTSLTFGPEGRLYVVDQMNSRIQVLTADGEYIDEQGELGVGFGNFVRPKDIVVDEVGRHAFSGSASVQSPR